MLRSGGLRALSPPSLLQRYCDRLLGSDPEAIEECVAFLELGSRGHWHNRARANLDRQAAIESAGRAAGSDKDHVRRLAQFVLAKTADARR